MNKIILTDILFAVVSILISCDQNKASQNYPEDEAIADSVEFARKSLEFYRDTLIGKFDGVHTDTLVAEPVGEKEDQDYPIKGCTGWYWNWRVFTTGGTVNELTLDHHTVGIRFVKEGDLNGDGTDEWGYVTEWPTSMWMLYNTFTFCDGCWAEFIPSFSVYLPHIEIKDFESGRYYRYAADLVSKGNSNGFVHIKFSDVRNEGADFLQIDTIISIPAPQPLK